MHELTPCPPLCCAKRVLTQNNSPFEGGRGMFKTVYHSLLLLTVFEKSKKKIYFCDEIRSHSSMDRMEVS